jgi:hypothetical protein
VLVEDGMGESGSHQHVLHPQLAVSELRACLQGRLDQPLPLYCLQQRARGIGAAAPIPPSGGSTPACKPRSL